jgi:hypothetical protein
MLHVKSREGRELAIYEEREWWDAAKAATKSRWCKVLVVCYIEKHGIPVGLVDVRELTLIEPVVTEGETIKDATEGRR